MAKKLKTNAELVRYLKRKHTIRSEIVENIFLKVDRANYIKENPYMDSPQPIGFAATISAPHIHAHTLEVLKNHLQKATRVLDIGCGSGYLTTCFALLMEEGNVIGIDHIPELVELATKNIQNDQSQLLPSGKIKLVIGDGRKGYAEMAPYDVIHVGAAALKIPDKLKDQLKNGGRMLIPLGIGLQDWQIIDKVADDRTDVKSLIKVDFVPLTDKKKQMWRYIY